MVKVSGTQSKSAQSAQQAQQTQQTQQTQQLATKCAEVSKEVAKGCDSFDNMSQSQVQSQCATPLATKAAKK